MEYRFNPPPGWPSFPPGWRPPPGWKGDPSWPEPPADWPWWVPIAGTEHHAAPSAPAPQAAAAPAPAAPTPPTGSPGPVGGSRRRGLFGGRKQIEQLEQENLDLRRCLDEIGGLEQFELRQRVDGLRREQDDLQAAAGRQRAELDAELTRRRADAERDLLHQRAVLDKEAVQLRGELAELRSQVVATRDEVILQEAGVYHYRHPLENAEQYKTALGDIRYRIKSLVSGGRAFDAATDWTVNGSSREGKKMVTQTGKLVLRAYNAEADNCVRTLKAYNLDASIKRLEKAAETIARLGSAMRIRISSDYHALRLRELELVADYQAKVAEEKEAARAERERLREEEIARRELQREQERLTKELAHYSNARAALEQKGDTAAAAELAAKVTEIQTAMAGLAERAANTRAGYVYVISNIGSMGKHIVKIGMTRRLDPQDRINELGDASVPFRFDVHAIIFSNDAVGLEANLHRDLAAVRVNLVNTRREFFYAAPTEVKTLLAKHAGNILHFIDQPEAAEWRQSQATRQ